MTSGHVFIAMSLDGFVARPDHRLDWLTKQPTGAEDHGYDDFVSTIDGIVMGSGSFRTVLGFGDWPYEKPVVVASTSMTQDDVPADLRRRVRVSGLEPADLMASLAEDGWRRAYVDGGRIVQSFIARRLIEEMTITLIPILIGEGLRLFGPLEKDIDLQLLASRSFGSGLVQTRYRLLPEDA